jgi:hypothetical protein
VAANHELADIRSDDAGSGQPFLNFERDLIQAAIREGERPSASSLPETGEIMRVHTDEGTGLKTNEFFSKQSFVKSMGREGRRVLWFIDPKTRSVLFGPPFDQAR